MDIARLTSIAIDFRRAIEATSTDVRPNGMLRFPFGACGDTSLLLGAYLADSGINGFVYVCGERGSKEDDSWTSHAWLQRDQCVIDITADQFEDAPAAVIVSEKSIWHQQFSTDKPSRSDFREWTGYSAEILWPIYRRLKERLDVGSGANSQ